MIGIEPGTLFGGRYQIIKSIGAGGMGAVYLAKDPRYADFFVALKIIYPGIIRTREARERLRNEIVASYRVNHPNVVRAYEYFDEDESQAFAMEYVDGGDLLIRISRGACSVQETISYLKQIASGLAAIHTQGIVHRDLKPENIMLTKTGMLKITDFGVARLRGAETLTQAGAMVGTPKYLAPEYIETGECDHRGDIYALGVIGYELVSGKSPFLSGSKVSLMVERLKSKVEPLNQICPDCPKDLAQIIERAMSVSLVRRYQTAAEVVEDLERVERGEPLGIDPVVESGRFNTEEIKRDPAILGALSGVLGRVGGQNFSGLWQRLSTLHRTIAQLIALALVVIIGATPYWWHQYRASDRVTLSQLPLGTYQGSVSGIVDADKRYDFVVWRTETGTFILLGKEYCQVAKLSAESQFSCGDLKFELAVSSIEDRNALGVMRETSWGSQGTFSLAKFEEFN